MCGPTKKSILRESEVGCVIERLLHIICVQQNTYALYANSLRRGKERSVRGSSPPLTVLQEFFNEHESQQKPWAPPAQFKETPSPAASVNRFKSVVSSVLRTKAA